MANRTTAAIVKGIMETALLDKEVETMITMANRMTTEIIGNASISATTLADIETWLTAHLIAMGRERQGLEERVNDIWITYQGKFGEGLKMTTYGQMVLMLDSTGQFTRANKQKAQIRATPQYPENYNS